jgi:hypothetical protein
MVIFPQRTFTSLVHAHAGRTQNVEAVNCGRYTTMSTSERAPATISP